MDDYLRWSLKWNTRVGTEARERQWWQISGAKRSKFLLLFHSVAIFENATEKPFSFWLIFPVNCAWWIFTEELSLFIYSETTDEIRRRQMAPSAGKSVPGTQSLMRSASQDMSSEILIGWPPNNGLKVR